MTPADAGGVLTIYSDGISTGHATFETSVPSWAEWDRAHRNDCRWLAEESGRAVGFAALSRVSQRAVYAGVAEVSVYVAEAARGRGVGRRLLEALVESSEDAGIWTLQAGIFPENTPSLALHERCGFRVVGVRRRLGRQRLGGEGVWRDVALLERRSEKVGTS